MIINSLVDYFDILEQDENVEISPYGHQVVNANYVAVITRNGELKDILQFIDEEKGKPVKKSFHMPNTMKSTGTFASPVCDNFSYVFGVAGEKGKKEIKQKEFETARTLHLEMFENGTTNEEIAIVNFFKNWNIESAWENEYIIKNYSEKGSAFTGNIIFRLEGEEKYFHDLKEIKEKWLAKNEDKLKKLGEYVGECSITGKVAPIAKLHPQFSVKGASTMGASLICFNKDSDLSYNLEQSYNSRVSQEVAHKYSRALTYLLSNENNKLFIGDDTAVFYAIDENDTYAKTLKGMFDLSFDDEKSKNKPDKITENLIKDILKQGEKGIYANPDSKLKADTKFCVLGLSPNAGRVSIRFYYKNDFSVFCNKIKQHYDDISICGNKKYISSYWLLRGTVSEKSSDKKVNPLLGGAVTRAILTGDSYPQIMFSQAIIRVKTEAFASQARSAIIKGYLVRQARIKNKEEEIFLSLNEDSNNSAYVLGRAFAILEMIQKNSVEGTLNSTIKDKYFSTACSNPSLVFPNLLKLTQHHLAKIEGNYYNILLTDVLSKLDGDTFPKILNMENQGRFILGYYQQTQKLYTKREKTESNQPADTEGEN